MAASTQGIGFLDGLVGRQLPFGYTVMKSDRLAMPYFVYNPNLFRIAMGREAAFAFPLAGAGFLLGGPTGVLGGHIVGAVLGYVRYLRIKEATGLK